MASNCENCRMRAKYDRNPKSLLGRIWKWHISFCPGWKQYLSSQPDDKRGWLEEMYGRRLKKS